MKKYVLFYIVVLGSMQASLGARMPQPLARGEEGAGRRSWPVLIARKEALGDSRTLGTKPQAFDERREDITPPSDPSVVSERHVKPSSVKGKASFLPSKAVHIREAVSSVSGLEKPQSRGSEKDAVSRSRPVQMEKRDPSSDRRALEVKLPAAREKLNFGLQSIKEPLEKEMESMLGRAAERRRSSADASRVVLMATGGSACAEESKKQDTSIMLPDFDAEQIEALKILRPIINDLIQKNEKGEGMDVHAFNRDKLLPNMSLIKPIIEKIPVAGALESLKERVLQRGGELFKPSSEIMNNVEKTFDRIESAGSKSSGELGMEVYDTLEKAFHLASTVDTLNEDTSSSSLFFFTLSENIAEAGGCIDGIVGRAVLNIVSFLGALGYAA